MACYIILRMHESQTTIQKSGTNGTIILFCVELKLLWCFSCLSYKYKSCTWDVHFNVCNCFKVVKSDSITHTTLRYIEAILLWPSLCQDLLNV